jgi:DNA-binding NarL/FixJ family response regulator
MGRHSTTFKCDRKVVIADRSAHLRETLRRVLAAETNAQVTGEAGSFRDAIRLIRKTGATVVLLDVDLAISQPAARLRKVAGGLPGVEVVVLLNEDTPGYRHAIAERWGYACVAKEQAEKELLSALRAMDTPRAVSRG